MALTVRILPPSPLEAFDDEPELVASFDGPRVVIGRGAGCDLVLPDPTVSARHASVRQRNAGYVIVDEGSTNGILVGGVKLPAQTPGPLRDRQLVRIGRIWLDIRIGVGCAEPTRKPDAIARSWVRRQLRAAGEPVCPVLRVAAGPEAGASRPLEEPGGEVVVGRSRQSDWTLDDPDLSRRHFAVELRGADVLVWDLNSKRGSLLAAEPLATEPRRWRPGEPLEVGNSVIELADPVPEALEELLRSPDERMRAAEFGESPPAVEGLRDAADATTLSGRPPLRNEADDGAGEPELGADDPGLVEGSDAGGEAADEAPGEEPDTGALAPPSEGHGGRLVELVVALVALAVIAVSAIGLLLLLRR